MATKSTDKVEPKIRKAPPGRGLTARTEPGEPMPSPFEEMERLFDGFFPHGWLRPQQWDWPALGEMAMPFAGRMPRIDVIDRQTEVLLRAELPGVEKDDLEVTVADEAVTIKATAGYEKKDDEGDFHRCEISRGTFSRSVSLPASIDVDAVKASFANGLLELRLPKLDKPAGRRVKIE